MATVEVLTPTAPMETEIEEPVMETTPVEESDLKTPEKDEATTVTEPVELQDDKIETDAVAQASCFDFSALCCGLPFNSAEAELRRQAEQEKLENEKAVQIQTAVRSKQAREKVTEMKVQKKAEEEAAAAAEAEAKAKAEAEAAAAAAAEAEAEAEAARALEEQAAAEEAKKKKGFMGKLRTLFQGCKKADAQVVTN